MRREATEIVSKEDAAIRTRDIIADTGCNWREASSKVLENIRLSKEDKEYLLAQGLSSFARGLMNRRRQDGNGKAAVPTSDDLLAPIAAFITMARIFQVGEESKPFLECDAADLGLIIDHLKTQRDGFTRSIRFIADVQVECERFKCKVKDLPTVTMLERKAPW